MPKKVLKTVRRNLSPVRWAVWIFPLFAVIIAGFLLYDYYAQRGPEIFIRFDDAANVEAGKTAVKYRGINVGVVDSVVLGKDMKEVLVKVRLQREAKDIAVEGSKFWVVTPQVDFAGISGLETLIKGPYIRVEPGKGQAVTEFKGNTGEEIKDPTTGTVAYTVATGMGDSLNPGDAVTFRGLKIGSITAVKLGSRAREVRLTVNIEREYVRLIRTNTVFWRKVGVHADVGLFGAEVKINSIESLLKGGIQVATPNDPGPIANAGEKFDLAEEPPKKWEEWDPKL